MDLELSLSRVQINFLVLSEINPTGPHKPSSAALLSLQVEELRLAL